MARATRAPQRAPDIDGLAFAAALLAAQTSSGERGLVATCGIGGWMKVLPDDVIRVRSVLNVGFVGALAAAGEFETVEARLHDAEQWLDRPGPGPNTPSAEMVAVDETQFRFLPGAIEMYRAALALVQGDVAVTMTHARRVLAVAPEDDQCASAAIYRSEAARTRALARWVHSYTYTALGGRAPIRCGNNVPSEYS